MRKNKRWQSSWLWTRPKWKSGRVSSRVLAACWTGLGCCCVSSSLLFAQDETSHKETAQRLPVPVTTPTAVVENLEEQVCRIFEEAKQAVVKISATDEHGTLSGTGFFVDPAGTIFTAYSVGGESHNIQVHVNGKLVPASRLVADPRAGVALLRVELEGTPFLDLEEPGHLEIAEPVLAVGYPLDYDVSPSMGVVAGFDKKHLGRYLLTTHIRANLPVQRGVGGAPVLSFDGKVVGMVMSGLEDGSACYVLPIQAVEKIRQDYLRFGELRRGWLGITVKQGEQMNQTEVDQLDSKSPAIEAGVMVKDILLAIGKYKIETPEDVVDASYFLTAGDPVVIEVERNGEILQLEAIPSQRGVISQPVAGDSMNAAPLKFTSPFTD